jgi:hypothetical protein
MIRAIIASALVALCLAASPVAAKEFVAQP